MISRAAEWVVRLELPILLLSSPFLLFPHAARSPVMLVVPLLWVARKLARGRFVRRTPLDWPLALLLLMVLVSVAVTFDILFSLPKVAGIVLGVGFFYALAELESKWLRHAVAIYLLGGVGLAALGILGAQRLNKFPFLDGLLYRIPLAFRGVQGAESGLQPNEVAGALLWFIPLYFALAAAALSVRGDGTRRVGIALLLLAGGLFTTAALLFVQSRSAMLGLSVAFLLLIALSGRVGQVVALLAVAVGAVALIVTGGGPLIDAFGGGAPASSALTGTLDPSSRLEIWTRALYAIHDFPLTGTGLNTFRRIMPVLYPTFIIPAGLDMGHAHNHLLQVAVDVGMPGLVAWIALWLTAGIMLAVTWMRAAPGAGRAAAAGFAACLLAWAVYGMTDTIALGAKPGVIFWSLLGMVAILFLGRARAAEIAPQPAQEFAGDPATEPTLAAAHD
jgi:putative inorganic carbon (HCO3(-)) transporter